MGSIFRSPLTGVTIGYYPMFTSASAVATSEVTGRAWVMQRTQREPSRRVKNTCAWNGSTPHAAALRRKGPWYHTLPCHSSYKTSR